MSSIKKTAPRLPPTPTNRRAPVSSCGPMTPTERAASSCGGWVSKGTRSKTKELRANLDSPACGWSAPSRKPAATVSSCGGVGWSRNGKLPSGC